jgi:hypothetical protein
MNGVGELVGVMVTVELGPAVPTEGTGVLMGVAVYKLARIFRGFLGSNSFLRVAESSQKGKAASMGKERPVRIRTKRARRKTEVFSSRISNPP